MLSYHADATIETNPYELGLDRLVAVDSEVEFIGKDALAPHPRRGTPAAPGRPRHRHGPADRAQHHVLAESPRRASGPAKVTSAVWSPRLEQNIALAMISTLSTPMPARQLAVETNLGPTGRRGRRQAVLRPEEIDHDRRKPLVVDRPSLDATTAKICRWPTTVRPPQPCERLQPTARNYRRG